LTFADILGHEPQLELLRRALGSGRFPHALLLHGPQGVGKGAVALAVASALVCDTGGSEPCGACVPCRKTEHGNHPDVMRIGRLPKKESRKRPGGAEEADDGTGEDGEGEEAGRSGDLRPFIIVAQIRDLIEHAAFAPREAPRRVFVVDPADRMNGGAQNALLKTLEEPPGRAVLILVASRPHLLLPTVRSRCLSVGFAPLPAERLASLLQRRGMSREEALARAALSGGRPGAALGLDLEALRELREEVLSACEELARGPKALAARLPQAEGIGRADEGAMLEWLDLLEGLLRDAARAASGVPSESLLHADLAARLAALGGALGPERAAALVRSIERLRGEMRFNLNRTLIAEALLAALAGAPAP
jgi:DNA polymerase III subunit delta'